MWSHSREKWPPPPQKKKKKKSLPARTRAQFEGGNKTRAGSISLGSAFRLVQSSKFHFAQRTCALYDTRSSLPPEMSAAACLSRALCCGVSCHPSRLYSALNRPPCRGVRTFAPGAPPTSCKFHYCAGTIRGRG